MNVQNLIGEDFRGAVLIARGEEVLFERAYGERDLANRIPNTMDTKFATASAGKIFVAVGILRLIEEGRLRLTSTLGEVLPMDWHSIDASITIGELLTHTSGIPDYFDESVMTEYEELWRDFPNYRIRSNRDLLPLFIDKPMAFERGACFAYNNTGFVVLAMVIERLTGEVFDAYLASQIFRPCGMTDTGYYELDRLPARCAMNYIYDDVRSEYRTNIYAVDAKGTGAGGAFTTLHDIRRFWDALLHGKLLSEEMTTRMLTRQSGDDEDAYGYGVWLAPTTEGFDPYIQGCDPGVSFVSRVGRTTGTTLAIVSNFGDDVWSLAEALAADGAFS